MSAPSSRYSTARSTSSLGSGGPAGSANILDCVSRPLLACFKMKKYMALWGSLFFFVICVSLYLMMETVNMNSRPNVRLADFDENDFNSIESQIHKVEQDIHKNHGTIREIKKILRHIANGDKSSITKLKHLFENEDLDDSNKDSDSVSSPWDSDYRGFQPQKPRPEVVIPGGVCPAFRTESKTQRKIRNAYDVIPFDNVDGGVWKQGWNLNYTPNHWDSLDNLQVFVVPHTHCDPGWQKTFVSYYQQQVQGILESMLVKLEELPDMRLIYAEISFFSMWWDEISLEKRARVKKLINDGKLEIVTGGWVMTDEANTHYFAMIDQMIEGHTWLNGTLGVKPQSGWSIDPFGLSPTMAYLLKQMGLKNMLIQRVHYSVKKYLAKKKELEFLWRQEWDDSGRTDIFCHLMPFYSYDIPHSCGPDPKICCQFDFSRLPGMRYNCPWKIAPVIINDENVAARAELLLDQYRKKSQLYRQNIVLIPLGDDFRYDKLDEWNVQYENYKKLFKYMNSQPKLKVNIKFGTLSDYFNAIYKKHKISPGDPPPNVPSLSGDFFTYADRDDHYWSGYFTTRPFQKILDREMEHQLRGAEILFFLVSRYLKIHDGSKFPLIEFMQSLVNARRNLALFQHHDGITGTAKDFVVEDYGDRLLSAMMDMKRLTTESVTFLMTKEKNKYSYSKNKPMFNVDERREKHYSIPERAVLKISDTRQSVLFYNSLAHKRESVVSVHVDSPFVIVRDPSGKIVPSQIDLFWTDRDSVSTDVYKVSFVMAIQALGICRYTVEKTHKLSTKKAVPSEITFYNSNMNMEHSSSVFSIKKSPSMSFSLENYYMKAGFNHETGLLQNITFKAEGIAHPVSIKFVSYGTRRSSEKSGAYLFLPDGEARKVTVVDPFIRIIRGSVISEVSVYVENVEHIVRVYNSPGTDSLSLDIYNLVDIRDKLNFEIAMRVCTDIKSENDSFHTDLNGFQMHRRKTYSKLPLQANYYPMPTAMFVENSQKRLNILSGQSLGAAYLKPGEMEVMLDRRLNQDDSRGLGQGVLDNKLTPNKFRLLLEMRKISPLLETKNQVKPLSLLARLTSLHLIHPVYVSPRNLDSVDLELLPSFSATGDGDSGGLTCDVHLLNLRTLQNKDDDPSLKFVPQNSAALILHRFSFDCDFSNQGLCCTIGNGKVNLNSLFKDIKLKDIRSTSLSLLYESNSSLSQSHLFIKPNDISAFKITPY